MPGKFKDAARILGKTIDVLADRNRKVNDMNRQLMRRAYGVDPVAARKIAAVLVDHAQVTWK